MSVIYQTLEICNPCNSENPSHTYMTFFLPLYHSTKYYITCFLFPHIKLENPIYSLKGNPKFEEIPRALAYIIVKPLTASMTLPLLIPSNMFYSEHSTDSIYSTKLRKYSKIPRAFSTVRRSH